MYGPHQSIDGTIMVENSILQGNAQALQIVGYFDEMILTNPLMSRAKKYKIGIAFHISVHSHASNSSIGAVYFMLANLDPALRSKLEAINLVAFFESRLLDKYSLDDILKPFISDLQQLNSVSYIMCAMACIMLSVTIKPVGWTFTLEDREYHFKGTLVAFVGDTPAVCLAGGYKEGVGMAMRKCRHCMATYNQIQAKVGITIMIECSNDHISLLSLMRHSSR